MWFVLVGLSLLSLYLMHVIYTQDIKPTYKNLLRKHVVVTGGSSGIGKAAAIEAAKQGAHVTIIGRDVEKLEKAAKEILSKCPDQVNQIIQLAVCDVTSDYAVIEACFAQIETKAGPIFMLINCAGACICGMFETMSIESIKSMMSLNYLGSALTTRCVLPKMRYRNEGIVVFVASEAAFVGLYGYSAYGAAKWAVRGLAEAVSMELVGTKVRVMISYPPDTDTPGLEEENKSKPEETKIISAAGGLHQADIVGSILIKDAMNGTIYSVYSTSGWLLNTIFGIQYENLIKFLSQVFMSGVFRPIVITTLSTFYKVIRMQLKKKNTRTNQ